MAAAGAPGSRAVAEAVLAQWAALPKTGKPQAHEHTVLAGIALSLPADGRGNGAPAGGQPQQAQQQPRLAVVALGTGTKCLGASRRLPGGVALNDCHAEALCRRALLRWLYGELLAAAQQAQQAAGGPGQRPPETAALRLVPVGGHAGAHLFGGWRAELQPGVRLHMYISQPPCGDASILHAEAGPCSHSTATAAGAAAAPAQGGGGGAASAGCYGRTGAKPLVKRPRVDPGSAAPHGLPAEQPPPQPAQREEAEQPAPAPGAGELGAAWMPPQQHEVESYAAAQATGVVRRKPGRGEATLSLACSDKLARWLLLGLQGSLLDGLLAAPLHLASVTVGLPPPAAPPPDGGAAAAQAPAEPTERPSSAAGSSAAPGPEHELAAAAEAALRRALLRRTAGLAAERLPKGRPPAAPALGVYAPADGGSRAQGLGLAPSAQRRVAGGASVVWFAPPTDDWRWRQPQAGAPPVLGGGTVEAVAGVTGLRVGSARPKAGQPVHSSAQPAVCKAALFARWRELTAILRGLPHDAQRQRAAEVEPTAAAAAEPQQEAERQADGSGGAGGALTYRAAKRAAGAAYGAVWARLRQPPSPLEPWIPKPPELEQFC